MRGRERLEKVMEYMKRYEYAITALEVLLDAVVGIIPKQIMMADKTNGKPRPF